MRLGDRCHCGGVLRCEQTKPVGAVRMRYLACSSCGSRSKERVFLDERGRVIAGNRNIDCILTIQCKNEHELTQVQQFLKEFREK